VVEGDQVDVIEQLHAKFNDDTEEAERRHAAELRTAQSRADAKIKAYRDAAEVSARECDAAEAALTGEREGHLASLKELRRVKAEFRETEARHAARVSELIEEVAAAKGEGEAKAQEADKAADALLKRVETLEVSRQEQLETDYVSRDAVAEMEKLFRSTIDALAARLEDLEGKRVSDVAAGRSRGRVSAGARAVLESLDAGEDLPPLHERFGGRRRAKPLATQNMPRAPPRRRVSAKPAIPRFY
jgi:chromosome segregation ATPase